MEGATTPCARSEWVCYKGKLDIYLRNQYFLNEDQTRTPVLCLANMSMRRESDKGKGILTGFLDAVEPKYDILIENVINDRLHGFFQNRGYTPIFYDWIESPVSYKKFR